MRVALIQRYRRGHELRKADMREEWGMLSCVRHERTLVARLEHPGTSPAEQIVPPLYGAVMSCSFGTIHVTGVQRDGTGMHGQHWMARLVHPGQMACAKLNGNPPEELTEAVYRHWWLLLVELQSGRHQIPMATAQERLGILQHEYWPFMDWVSATGRGYVDDKGGLAIQRLDAAPPVLRGAIRPAPEMSTAPPPEDPLNPFDADLRGLVKS